MEAVHGLVKRVVHVREAVRSGNYTRIHQSLLETGETLPPRFALVKSGPAEEGCERKTVLSVAYFQLMSREGRQMANALNALTLFSYEAMGGAEAAILERQVITLPRELGVDVDSLKYMMPVVTELMKIAMQPIVEAATDAWCGVGDSKLAAKHGVGLYVGQDFVLEAGADADLKYAIETGNVRSAKGPNSAMEAAARRRARRLFCRDEKEELNAEFAACAAKILRNLSHGVPGTPSPNSMREKLQQSFLSVTCVSVIALFMNEWPEDLDEDPDIVEDMAVVLWNISSNVELTTCSQFFVYGQSLASTMTLSPRTPVKDQIGIEGVNVDGVAAAADNGGGGGGGEGGSGEKDAVGQGGGDEQGNKDVDDEMSEDDAAMRCGFTTVALKLMHGIFYRLQPETAESPTVVSRTLDSLGRILHVAENRQLFMRTILHDPELRFAEIVVRSLRAESMDVVAAAVRLLLELLNLGDSAVGNNFLNEDVRIFVARDMRIISEVMRIALHANTLTRTDGAQSNADVSKSASTDIDVCRQAAVVIQGLSASHVSRQCVLPYERDALEGAMCSDRQTASIFCAVLHNLSKLPNVQP